jgi:transposase
MVKPLSNDLRERVVAFVEVGHSRRAAAAHFRYRHLSSSS